MTDGDASGPYGAMRGDAGTSRSGGARYAKTAAALVLAALALLIRPETVQLETGNIAATIEANGERVLVTEADGILLQAEDGVLTLPSLRPGSHLLTGRSVPQVGWRRIEVGDSGPERHGPGRTQLLGAASGLALGELLRRREAARAASWAMIAAGVASGNPAAAAAGLLARTGPAGTVAGAGAWGALISAPWLPETAAGAILLPAAASILPAAVAAGRRQPGRSPALPVAIAAGTLAAGLLWYSAAETQPKPLTDCFDAPTTEAGKDEAHMLQCIEEQTTLLGHQRRLEEGREQLRNLEQDATARGFRVYGPWCRIGEETLTEAHVLAGGAFEDALREGAICDFSLEHGIGSAAGWALERPELISNALCRVREDVEAVPEMQISQCWHGIGQGVARRNLWDIAELNRSCLRGFDLADSFTEDGLVVNGNPNCIEGGVFAGLTRERLGGTAVMRLDADVCGTLREEYATACTRYIPERQSVTDGPLSAADTMRSTCEAAVDLPGCWEAVGTYAGHNFRGMHELPQRAGLCYNGPEAEWRCIISLYTIVAGPAAEMGIDGETLLNSLPEGHSAWVEELLRRNFALHAHKDAGGQA